MAHTPPTWGANFISVQQIIKTLSCGRLILGNLGTELKVIFSVNIHIEGLKTGLWWGGNKIDVAIPKLQLFTVIVGMASCVKRNRVGLKCSQSLLAKASLKLKVKTLIFLGSLNANGPYPLDD